MYIYIYIYMALAMPSTWTLQAQGLPSLCVVIS